MIVFDLACDCGLVFEGWFQDNKELSDQVDLKTLHCPKCGSTEVRKILSPVRTSSRKEFEANSQSQSGDQPDIDNANKILKDVQDFVISNFEDVGTKMAEESLKIHYGLTEPRNIRGVVSEEDEKVLEKEGIDLLKIPMPRSEKETN